jgi:hypothetical protein
MRSCVRFERHGSVIINAIDYSLMTTEERRSWSLRILLALTLIFVLYEIAQDSYQFGAGLLRASFPTLELDPSLVEAVEHLNARRRALQASPFLASRTIALTGNFASSSVRPTAPPTLPVIPVIAYRGSLLIFDQWNSFVRSSVRARL